MLRIRSLRGLLVDSLLALTASSVAMVYQVTGTFDQQNGTHTNTAERNVFTHRYGTSIGGSATTTLIQMSAYM